MLNPHLVILPMARPLIGSRCILSTIVSSKIGHFWSYFVQKNKHPGVNSHPGNAPYMAQLVMFTFELLNRNLGWSSGKFCVPSLVRRRFETACNDFLFSRLLRSQRFLRRFFMIAIETTFTRIDCIGDFYYCDDNRESYPTLVY